MVNILVFVAENIDGIIRFFNVGDIVVFRPYQSHGRPQYWAYQLSNRERSLQTGNVAIMVAINDPRRKSIVVVLVLREAKDCCPAPPKSLCKCFFFGIDTLYPLSIDARAWILSYSDIFS